MNARINAAIGNSFIFENAYVGLRNENHLQTGYVDRTSKRVVWLFTECFFCVLTAASFMMAFICCFDGLICQIWGKQLRMAFRMTRRLALRDKLWCAWRGCIQSLWQYQIMRISPITYSRPRQDVTDRMTIIMCNGDKLKMI